MIPNGKFKRKIIDVTKNSPRVATIGWKPNTTVMFRVSKITGSKPENLIGSNVEIVFNPEKSEPAVLVLQSAKFVD